MRRYEKIYRLEGMGRYGFKIIENFFNKLVTITDKFDYWFSLFLAEKFFAIGSHKRRRESDRCG